MTPKHVRPILGLCSYHRRFVNRFADIAKPLYKLSEKGSQFGRSEACESAFKLLKDTGASEQDIGAVLSQVQHGQEIVVAY